MTAQKRITDKAFFDRDPRKVARDLLGCIVTRVFEDGSKASGRIVEIEAYLGPSDGAAHSVRGETKATKSLFAGSGIVYIHPMRQFCGMDFVCDAPRSLLIRALEPIDGIDGMMERRGTTDVLNLASGPGKLTRALGIDRSMDGLDLMKRTCPIRLSRGEPVPAKDILASRRIGITKNAEPELRFTIKRSPYVSR